MHQPLASLPSGLSLLHVSDRLSITDGLLDGYLPVIEIKLGATFLQLGGRHECEQTEQLTDNLHLSHNKFLKPSPGG